MKSPNSNPSRKIPAPAPSRCAFSFSDGRRCTMLRRPPHASLCPFHASAERHILEADEVNAAITTLSGEFYTVNDVNHALGKLFRLVAANRIPPRTASTLAYLGQLLLYSISGVEGEVRLAQGNEGWEELVTAVLCPDPPEPAQQSATTATPAQ